MNEDYEDDTGWEDTGVPAKSVIAGGNWKSGLKLGKVAPMQSKDESETWVNIPWYDNKYTVSSLWNTNISGVQMKRYMWNWYYKVYIWWKLEYVHRLVWKAFIENPDNKPCINHKNSNRLDNRVKNLEWCTKKENAIHWFVSWNHITPVWVENKNSKIIDRHTLEWVLVETTTTYDLVKKWFDRAHVSKCCRWILLQHKGFIFKYHTNAGLL